MNLNNSLLRNFALLYGAALLSGLGWGMVIPTIPSLTESFDISVGAAAQTVTAYAAGRFAGTPVAGIMVDRLGPRPMMVAGASVTSLAAVFAFLSPWFGGLLVSLAVIGAADAIWTLGREVAGIDLTRQDQRGRVMSGFHGVHSVGLTLGPLIGGILTETTGFRTVYLVYALSAGIAVFLGLVVDSPERRETETQPSPARAQLHAFGLRQAWQRLWGLFRQIEPSLRSTYAVLVLATVTSLMFRFTVQSMLPLYAAKHLGSTPVEIGLLFTISGIVVFGMIVPAGFVLDKIGRKWATVPSHIIPAVVFLLIPFTTTFAQLVALMCFSGIASGLSLGSLATSCYDVVPQAARGRLQAARRTIADLGGLFAPLLGGVLANAFNPGMPFLVFAPILAFSALLLALVAKETLARH